MTDCPIRPTRDLTGMRFGMLVVQKRSENRGNGKQHHVMWDCLCDCGNTHTVRADSLLSGRTTSCGCRKFKHGGCVRARGRSRLYRTWESMHTRCDNPSNNRWEHYGGRGIKVCTEWDDFDTFQRWALSHGYADNLTIDRIDVNGNYCPENCRFADAKAQANNTTRNVRVEYDGKTYTISELAGYLGCAYTTIWSRYRLGWSVERIVSEPLRRKRKGAERD